MQKVPRSDIRSHTDDNLNSTDQSEMLHFPDISQLLACFILKDTKTVTSIYKARKIKPPRMFKKY